MYNVPSGPVVSKL